MVILLASIFGSATALKVIIPLLRESLIDRPNTRSSHLLPTPRGGGLVFVLITAATSILLLSVKGKEINNIDLLAILVVPLAIIGIIDDKYDISPRIRYVIQLVTAISLLYVSNLATPLILVPLIIIGITAVINFTNFMDGIDGLVAGCMMVTISTYIIDKNSTTLEALVGALIGFLIWNWYPAKVFMGDIGSLFLGAIFSGIVLQHTDWEQACSYLLISTPMVGDACICVIRRAMKKQNIFKPHKLHLYQRLHQGGWSHAKVASLYIIATLFLSLVYLMGSLYMMMIMAAMVILIGLWLDQKVAIRFTQ